MRAQFSLPGFEPQWAQLYHAILMTLLPPEVAAHLTERSKTFCARARLHGPPRPTSHLHVTLHSAGRSHSVSPDTLAITEPTETVFRSPAFPVTFDRIASFQSHRERAPVVLLPDLPSCTLLRSLYREVGEALFGAAFDSDRRADSFQPHVTLLYDRRRIREREIAPITWTITNFSCVLSIVGQTRYVHLRRWHLLT